MIRVTVWNEFLHETREPEIAAVYPNGIHAVIADFLGKNADMTVRTATLEEPEHGLTVDVLENTDVLIWWGHMGHRFVADEIVERVCNRVLKGMGLIVLHSGHASKVFRRLMGTNTHKIRWREDGSMARFWVVDHTHPIAEGIGDYFELEAEETYGEYFDIPRPDDLVFITWMPGGEIFRGGCCWNRGLGRVFYFQPGHETYPIYYDANVQRVITNAVRWAYRPVIYQPVTGKVEAMKDISLGMPKK